MDDKKLLNLLLTKDSKSSLLIVYLTPKEI